jgi:large subunit ribosomal protein L4
MPNTALTFDAAAYTANGTARERVPLPAELFDGTVNMPVMQQAVKAFLANQRQGTAATKTRGFVTGGNQKPWRQKGTGRARQGSIRAPHWPGGGTVFGPQPRRYTQSVPKQVRALARKSAFNARAREGALWVIDRFDFEAPKTAKMVGLLERLGLAMQKVLVLTNGVNQNVYLSARNIGTVRVLPYSDVSTYHILWSDVVLVEAGALGQELEPVAESESAPEAEAKPRRGAAKKATRTSTTKAASTTKEKRSGGTKGGKAAASKRAAKAPKRAAAKPAAKAAKKSASKKKGK